MALFCRGALWHVARVSKEETPSTPVGAAPKSPSLERLRRNLDDYMNEKGLRTTEQRKLIVNTFFESDAHATIEDLLQRVRAVDSRVGYATVYRTMKMLSEGGMAKELHFGDGATRYEIADDDAHHDHLICEECGNIVEFEEPLIEELQERIALQYGLKITHHKHELYGTCIDVAACRARREKR